MPGNMANLMKQAQKMQRQMEENQRELETKEFTAKAGGGAVEDGGGIGHIGLSHEPVPVVAGLDEDIAVGIEGGRQLAVYEFVLTRILCIFLAAVVGAVDEANQIVSRRHIIGIFRTAAAADAIHIIMSQSIYIVCNIGVTARAGVGRVALFGTGGSRDHVLGVIVSDGVHHIGIGVGYSTDGTLMSGVTVELTSGRYHGIHELVSVGGDGLIINVTALGTGVGSQSGSRTGGRSRDLGGVAVGAFRRAALRVGDGTIEGLIGHVAKCQTVKAVDKPVQLNSKALIDRVLAGRC